MQVESYKGVMPASTLVIKVWDSVRSEGVKVSPTLRVVGSERPELTPVEKVESPR